MPFRTRALLPVRLTALLALCLAAGCQSRSLTCPSCGGAVQTAGVSFGLPHLLPAENFRAAPTTTVALKPANGAADGDNTSVIASSWHGVERLAPPDGAAETVSLTPPPQPAPVEPRPLPTPPLAPLAVDAGPVHEAPATLAGPIATTRAPGPDEALHMPAPVAAPAMVVAPPPHVVDHGFDNVPREGFKQSLPPYVVEPPDVLLIRATKAVAGDKVPAQQPIDGPHLVRPDGTVDLGIYGSIFVAGMTLNDIRTSVAEFMVGRTSTPKLTAEQIRTELYVDVISYNSKFYYVITDNAGYGEVIVRRPVTGNETVLDALASIQGLPNVASKKKIWLARPTADHRHLAVLPIDYKGITKCGSNGTNYQLYPGDRLYIASDPLLTLDSRLAKIFSPIERIFGVTLLGSSTVNSIRNRNGG